MSQVIQIENQYPIATLIFNDPTHNNVFNLEMAQAFSQALKTVIADPQVRVIVLRANGRLFMAGGDLKLFFAQRHQMKQALEALGQEVMNITTLLAQSPKPILAAVHGAVAGIGLSFMLCADVVLAQEGTQFTTAYSRLGLTPDGAMSYWLPRIVGQKKAMELLFLSPMLDTTAALALGLINWVASADQFATQTTAIAQELAQGPTCALAQTRQLLHSTWEQSYTEQVISELEAFEKSTQTKDFQIGIEAFVQKHSPVFEGK